MSSVGPRSTKRHQELNGIPGSRVPFRRVTLSDGERLDLYDTSGPHTGHLGQLTPGRGLCPRPGVASDRGTQLQRARAGVVTAEMAFVAVREGVRPRVIRDHIAAGRAVIPANHRHPECEPMVIGKAFRVKVEASVRHSTACQPSSIDDVVDVVARVTRSGADAITHWPAGGRAEDALRWLLRHSPVPVRTVPIHRALQEVGGDSAALTWPVFRDVVVAQAEEGVDYMTVHAAVRHQHVSLVSQRLTGIVSHGGSIMAQWCSAHGRESFLYTNFGELCEIFAAHDVTMSLGAGLRSGSIADAGDAARFAELRTVGELAKVARSFGVQVMVDGPGRMPLGAIVESVRLHEQLCDNAPLCALGPSPSGLAALSDDASAAVAAHAGAALLRCAAEPRRTQPGRADPRANVVAGKIAAHVADVAKGHPGAVARDDALARAHRESRWHDFAVLSFDPDAVCPHGGPSSAIIHGEDRGPPHRRSTHRSPSTRGLVAPEVTRC